MALNKIDPTKFYKTCSILDPSIDKEATGDENLVEFSKNHNMEVLKFKEGEHPTVFRIKNIKCFWIAVTIIKMSSN